MHRALPGGTILLVLLVATALSGGCVALYTVSEAADPPQNAPGGDARAGLPLFPPGIPVSTPVPAPSVTPGPEPGGDGEPFVPVSSYEAPPVTAPPSEPPAVPLTRAPTALITAPPSDPPAAPLTRAPTAPITAPPSEPPAVPLTWAPTTPIPLPTMAGTLPVDDGLPGRDEVYHPVVTPLPPA